jgi:hypothetical protein
MCVKEGRGESRGRREEAGGRREARDVREVEGGKEGKEGNGAREAREARERKAKEARDMREQESETWTNFSKLGVGIGDDENSWSIDLLLLKAWHQTKEKYSSHDLRKEFPHSSSESCSSSSSSYFSSPWSLCCYPLTLTPVVVPPPCY